MSASSLPRHIESISNGLGSQSMYLLVMAAEGEIPATVSITADTGAEEDRLWSTGERTAAREYFERVVAPFGAKHGIETRFVRAVDGEKRPLPTLLEHTRECVETGRPKNIMIPVFGSDGGRRTQTCTDRWKIRAIDQEHRRMGAKTVRTAQGIHYGEAARRVKGRYVGEVGGWDTYAAVVKRRGKEYVSRWKRHYYPLVDRRLNRHEVRDRLERRGIPYLISSECDFCPHQDFPRWQRHTPESLAASAALEASFGGEYFLTDRRIPLMRAIEQMREEAELASMQGALWGEDPDFGCGNSYCGV